MSALSRLTTNIPHNKRIFIIENGSRELDLVREQGGVVSNSVIHTITRESDNEKQNIDQENLGYLNPPVLSVFRDFLARIRLVDPDVSAALRDMKMKIENEVFREWCDALIACQHDRGLKTTLTPIVAKLSDMRLVNGELENLVTEPRKEFIIMQILLVGNIPLMWFLNKGWYETLMYTLIGQAILAICGAALFITTAFVVKLTQPIEY